MATFYLKIKMCHMFICIGKQQIFQVHPQWNGLKITGMSNCGADVVGVGVGVWVGSVVGVGVWLGSIVGAGSVGVVDVVGVGV